MDPLCAKRNIVYNQILVSENAPIFSRYESFSREFSRCIQCCWRTNKSPTCVPDFEKHPPLFIGTWYTLELPFPLKKRQFRPQERKPVGERPVSRKLILKSLISGQRVTSISHSPPAKIHESLSRSFASRQ